MSDITEAKTRFAIRRQMTDVVNHTVVDRWFDAKSGRWNESLYRTQTYVSRRMADGVVQEFELSDVEVIPIVHMGNNHWVWPGHPDGLTLDDPGESWPRFDPPDLPEPPQPA